MTTSIPRLEPVTSPDPDVLSGTSKVDADWWRQAAVYQIYPRSFADSNGDGIGDLEGIRSRIGYLVELGIDAVWLSPLYPSALADGGYDVDDYRDVDPRIGTLEQFDALVDALHAVDIKVIVDLVPNHTSNRHEWFRAALAAGRGSRERAMYCFKEGRGEAGELPPTNWSSIFGGPAWTRVPDGQWYLHLFAPEQPDLNWTNPDVRSDFLGTLRFWAERGVDGFRVDVAQGLAKDLSDPMPVDLAMNDHTAFEPGQHPFWDRDEVHEIYAEWRELFNSYTPPLVGVAEAWVPRHRRTRYATPESLGQAFNFDLLRAGWNAEEIRTIIADNLDLVAESGSSSTWVFSNHDVVRHATRFGMPDGVPAKRWLLKGGVDPLEDRERGRLRSRAVSMLAFALPGSMYLYQGEELGLPEVAEIPDTARQDPTFFRSPGVDMGRDGCRVPLPWTKTGGSFGFGGDLAHLPQPGWFGDFSVEVQDGDPNSTLELYRRALRLRRELQGAESFRWLDLGPNVVAFQRSDEWFSATNFGSEPVSIPTGRLLLSSDRFAGPGLLAPDTTVWIAKTGN
jgi:alpha-glucosidase